MLLSDGSQPAEVVAVRRGSPGQGRCAQEMGPAQVSTVLHSSRDTIWTGIGMRGATLKDLLSLPAPTPHLSGKVLRPPRIWVALEPKGPGLGYPLEEGCGCRPAWDTKGGDLEAWLFPKGGEGHTHTEESTAKARDTMELEAGMEGWTVCVHTSEGP